MTTAATFAATLVDEWCRGGVTDAVLSPGSRSSPMALALAAEPRLRLHVILDERSAGFFALGLALSSGRPAVVLTTSGTAAVELHPAVVEAHQAGAPMVACTADRPPELQDVGAPQAIDQNRLYGSAVRWFCAPGVPDPAAAGAWRSLASRALAEALGWSGRPGPVQLNLAFREPLLGEPDILPPGRADGRPWHQAPPTISSVSSPSVVADLAGRATGRRGVIVAGAGAGAGAAAVAPVGAVSGAGLASGGAPAVHRLAEVLGWPVLADPRSGCRPESPITVGAFDGLLRHAGFASEMAPDVVLRLGAPPASKVLSSWLATCGAEQILVEPTGAWLDPQRSAEVMVAADPGLVCATLADSLPAPAPAGWLRAWAVAEGAAQTAFDQVLADHQEVTEPGVARALTAGLPDQATLMVASSMPIRDVEWYGRPRNGLRVLANRGANGIDGTVSTALGAAAAHRPTVGLLGDLAFLHDSGGLLGAGRRGIDCPLVVVDNDGGGIFSFLPQAAALPQERYELLFGTPHRMDLAVLARAHGLAVAEVGHAGDLAPAVGNALDQGGVSLALVRTNRQENVAVHDELHAAVAAALEQTF